MNKLLFAAMLSVAAGSALADQQDSSPGGYHQASTIVIQQLQKNADDGDAEAQNRLAWAYHNGAVVLPRDDSKALEWFEKSALLGNSDSQVSLGGMYERGLGVPRNYAEAMNWYRRAADQGNPTAHFNIGFLYLNGVGVPQDVGQAMNWFLKAADLGSLRAPLFLGQMYDHGWKVREEKAEAAKWYRKAAEQGNAEAQRALGGLLLGAQGVPQDYAEALKWFQKASDQGDSFATGQVGRFFDNGWAVPVDKAQAQLWYRKMFSQAATGRKALAGQIFEADLAREPRRSVGMHMQALTEEMAKSLGVPGQRGVIVAGVSAGGPAETAGIKPGDVIVRLDGMEVADLNVMPLILAQIPGGKDIKLGLIRAGKPIEAHIVAGD